MKISVILLHIFIIFAHLGSVMHDTFIDEIAIELEEYQSHDELFTPTEFTFKKSYPFFLEQEISIFLALNFISICIDKEINPPDIL